MITQTKDPATLKQSEDFKSYKFGIKAEGLSHIFNVLRNQLYSDKTLAVVREYSCNAFDAHVEAGRGDEPIEITLPTRMNPNFHVRDFGLGLSEKDIQDIYANYGESTKRNTNAQIGQLGLGCKSGFAYGDNFVIISYQNGCKTTYNAFIDPSQVGQISKMSSEKTKERDGIEIVIPVKDGDADNFVDKAQDLFKFWNVKPIVKGAKLDLSRKAVVLRGEGWVLRGGTESRYGYRASDNSYAIMGNIAYPIEEYSCDFSAKATDDDDAAILRSMASSGLEIQFDIGELEISASREALQYTDYTQKQIIKKLQKVREEMVEQVTKNLTNAPSMYEAKRTYGQVFDYGSPLYRFSSLFKGKVEYKGKPVGSDSFTLGNIEHKDIALKEYAHPNRGYKVRGNENYSIKCIENRPIVLNDCGMRSGILNRIAPLIEMGDNHIGEKAHKVYFITPHNKKVWAKWKKDNNFDAPVIKLSELPAVKMALIYPQAASSKGSGYVKNAKHTTKVFEYDFASTNARWHTTKSDWWNCGEIDLEKDSYVYVKMDKFKPINPLSGREVDPCQIKHWKETLALAGIEMPKKLVGLKVKTFEGKNPVAKNKKAVELFSYITEELKNIIKSKSLEQKLFDRNYLLGHNGVKQDWMMAVHNNINWEDLADRNGDMALFKLKFNTMMHGCDQKLIDGIREICNEFSIELKQDGLKPTHDISSEAEKVMNKYEMLEFVGGSWKYGWGHSFLENCKKQVVNYINVIDICSK